jgi:hypothetical protein
MEKSSSTAWDQVKGAPDILASPVRARGGGPGGEHGRARQWPPLGSQDGAPRGGRW